MHFLTTGWKNYTFKDWWHVVLHIFIVRQCVAFRVKNVTNGKNVKPLSPLTEMHPRAPIVEVG